MPNMMSCSNGCSSRRLTSSWSGRKTRAAQPRAVGRLRSKPRSASLTMNQMTSQQQNCGIDTKRLWLRPFTSHDLDQLHHLWTDQTTSQSFWDGKKISRDEAERAVAASISAFSKFGFGQWVILLKGQPPLIGSAGLLLPDHPFYDREVLPEDQGIVELIFAILPDYRGHGYATEAVRAVLEFSFKIGSIKRVVAIADTPNVASIRILEKVGMERERCMTIGGQEVVIYKLGKETGIPWHLRERYFLSAIPKCV
jgi:RimJ/RimL family protein N-acetyltransferase